MSAADENLRPVVEVGGCVMGKPAKVISPWDLLGKFQLRCFSRWKQRTSKPEFPTMVHLERAAHKESSSVAGPVVMLPQWGWYQTFTSFLSSFSSLLSRPTTYQLLNPAQQLNHVGWNLEDCASHRSGCPRKNALSQFRHSWRYISSLLEVLERGFKQMKIIRI